MNTVWLIAIVLLELLFESVYFSREKVKTDQQRSLVWVDRSD